MYVLGQPGAGKLLAARMVCRAMRPGTARLVGNDFKASHPRLLPGAARRSPQRRGRDPSRRQVVVHPG
ncbi:hypothetical protein [Streptomyces bluensis]|uniref:ATPase AAA-type core domain-containing protein n=1 Tax=Streptomyces bluensis TaxID=33897 RepID=A0ABW6UGW1_9ACTN